MVSSSPLLVSRLLCLTALLVVAACDPPPPEVDAGGGEDAGGLDAGPACADFTGAYRTETLLDPCLVDTPIRIGALCVSQDGCEATVSGTHGAVSATADGDELSFETEFLRCTATRAGDVLTISCEDPDFGSMCSVTANAAPALPGVCCSTDAQCGDGDRCAAVTLAPSSPVSIASACVPAGPGALGGSCQTASGVGDCGAGLTCTSGGLGDDAVECRALCRGAGDCESTETCVWYALTTPGVGFCAPTCTLYGEECGAGATCDGVTALAADASLTDGLACRLVGNVATRGACSGDTDCGADHQCARPPGGGDLRCHPICGPDNDCESADDRCVRIGVSEAPVAGACIPR